MEMERTNLGLNVCIDHRDKEYGGYVTIARAHLQRDQKCVANVFTRGVRPVEESRKSCISIPPKLNR